MPGDEIPIQTFDLQIEGVTKEEMERVIVEVAKRVRRLDSTSVTFAIDRHELDHQDIE